MKENKKLISEILADVRHDMTDEEILNLLASSRVSVNPEKESGKLTSLGQRAADSIAKFAGSWAFIFSFTGVLLAWMILNVLLAAKAFDPYPFILLNLVLSCVAAIQAPLIMDEPEPAGGKGPRAWRRMTIRQSEDEDYDRSTAR